MEAADLVLKTIYPFIEVIGIQVYKDYATSSFNMWQLSSQLALFETTNAKSFKMFANVIENMYLPDAPSDDLINLGNFIR